MEYQSIEEIDTRIDEIHEEMAKVSPRDMSEPTTAEINLIRELVKLVKLRRKKSENFGWEYIEEK